MAHILDATRSELRKLEKPVNEAEFRQMAVVATNPRPPGENRVRAEATDNPTAFRQTANYLEPPASSTPGEEPNAAAIATQGTP